MRVVETERLITLDEVSELMQVSVPTVRRWIKAGKLPATKPGGVYRVRGRDFEEFVEKHTGKAQALPSPAEASEGRRFLAERRLLAPLHPFATQVEARTEFWQGLAESGKVSRDRLEDATAELGFTALGFKALADAAITEHWGAAELGLLGRVYKSIAGPYREAWNALMEAWVDQAGAADTQTITKLRLVTDADDAMRVVEEAEEAARTAA